MPTDALAERILRFVQARGYRPKQVHELARAMGVGESEQGNFHDACKALMKTGRVVMGARNALTLPPPPGKIVGTYRANPRGFGFLIPDTPDGHGDLFIPPGKSGGALTGDTVAARVVKRGHRDGKMLFEGRIVEIIQRGQSRFVGELCQQGRRWYVVPDGNTLHGPVLVGDTRAKNARQGDQVVFQISQYPAEGVEARGVIVKVLGRRGEPDVDTRSIIEQYGLPDEFGKKVTAEADAAVRSFDPAGPWEGREDLRKLTLITIDPDDARDFDDAISLTNNDDGTVELGVHIADVAHFVREGGALDTEARQRSTSVYLPRTVIPMLPETLSNGVCSLQQGEPRFAKSVFVTYGRGAKVKGVRLANSVIRSSKRLTYQQAGAVLDGRGGRVSAKVVSLLEAMARLARAIRRRRVKDGMLELDLPEIDLVYDDDGRVAGVRPSEDDLSHKIIEMFMVEANEAVARTLSDLGLPFLRRVHEEPRDLAGEARRRFLAAMGYDLPERVDRKTLQRLLNRVRGRPAAFPVHLAILRAMQQAEYAPSDAGHFALASRHYCHFTSPIRRYPDLTVHRLIDAVIRGRRADHHATPGKPRKARRTGRKAAAIRNVIPPDELARLGALCSANERRAESAERELRLVLLLRFLQDHHLGEAFDGLVTGVANVGVFVQLEPFLIDGLLSFDQLPDDWWEVDSGRGCIVGERSGKRITIGDRLRVRIATIRLATRQMELALAVPLKPVRGESDPTAGSPGRGKHRRGRPADSGAAKRRGQTVGASSPTVRRVKDGVPAGRTKKPGRGTGGRRSRPASSGKGGRSGRRR